LFLFALLGRRDVMLVPRRPAMRAELIGAPIAGLNGVVAAFVVVRLDLVACSGRGSRIRRTHPIRAHRRLSRIRLLRTLRRGALLALSRLRAVGLISSAAFW